MAGNDRKNARVVFFYYYSLIVNLYPRVTLREYNCDVILMLTIID
jgi:hypothetical protein